MAKNIDKQQGALKPTSPPSSSNPQGLSKYQDMGYNWGHETPKNILLYIDNSNIFEESRKHSARLKGYLSGIIDVALRIDVGKLISKAVGGRELLFGKLYGSEPPALDTVWEAIRRKHVQVKTFERSKWTLKEKEIDASITADAVEDIVEQKEQAGDDRTLILFSGDRDLLRVVDKAMKHGYRVEIWSLRSAINNAVIRVAKANPTQIQINELDGIFKDVTFTQVVWGKQKIPRERSLVASVNVPEGTEKKKFFEEFVAKAGSVFRMPMNGKYIDNYKNIVLVPCFSELYTAPVSKAKKNDEKVTVRKYDFYKHIQPFIPTLQEHFKEVCSSIVTWDVFTSSRYNVSDPTSFLSSTRFQLLDIGDKDDEDDEQKEEVDDGIGDLPSSEDDAEESDEDSEMLGHFDAPHEITLDDFIPNVPKHKPNKSHSYSGSCTHKFWCRHGTKCAYKHTDKEKEFFKIQTNSNMRLKYKIKPCYYNINSVCKNTEKSYLCPYAHSLEESRCLCCGGKGNGLHWMDQCPDNTNNVHNGKN